MIGSGGVQVPYWHAYTPGWEDAEQRAALYLYGAHVKALLAGRHADAEAIRREMTTA